MALVLAWARLTTACIVSPAVGIHHILSWGIPYRVILASLPTIITVIYRKENGPSGF
jgi:hypothetical protein